MCDPARVLNCIERLCTTKLTKFTRLWRGHEGSSRLRNNILLRAPLAVILSEAKNLTRPCRGTRCFTSFSMTCLMYSVLLVTYLVLNGDAKIGRSSCSRHRRVNFVVTERLLVFREEKKRRTPSPLPSPGGRGEGEGAWATAGFSLCNYGGWGIDYLAFAREGV